MNFSIRKVALWLGLAFLVLFAQLNFVQLARSRDLTNDRRNRRTAIAEEGVERGAILAADGTVLATSVPSGDPRFVWSRRYPEGALFGQITGYYTSPFFCDSAGVERTQSDYLSGRMPPVSQSFVDQLLGTKQTHGNVLKLTLDPALQSLARAKFGAQRGGVAVLNANNGAVLALYGSPSYDPNRITREPLNQCARAKQALERDPDKVLLSRAYQERYPPGSTFKIITTAAGLELGKMTPQTSFPYKRRLALPDTDKTLGNFGSGTCGGSLQQSFRVSCNTTFAQVGLRIGEKKLVTMAERFGLDRDLPFDLNAIPSCIKAPFTGIACDPPELSRPFVAYSAIGQGDVRVTPLQMALVGATVSNGGYVPVPHVVSTVLDSAGKVLRRAQPQRSARIYSARTAGQLRRLMSDVVCSGTGRVVRFKNSCKGTIGGKTGTAQVGIEGKAPHVWFVAWGPGVAVAVVVENGGTLKSEATGGKVAGPIAKALLEAVLAKRGKS